MIETDGVSCSIVLILKDKVGNIAKAKKGGSEPYIDDLTSEERAGLSGKKIVGIDPNVGDLLYCVDSDQRDQKLFRYFVIPKILGGRKQNCRSTEIIQIYRYIPPSRDGTWDASFIWSPCVIFKK